jgi:hypothetical protein
MSHKNAPSMFDSFCFFTVSHRGSISPGLRFFLWATPHNVVCGALRKFYSRISLHRLAIHKVLPRQCASFRSKICSQIALAELCGVAFAAYPCDLFT